VASVRILHQDMPSGQAELAAILALMQPDQAVIHGWSGAAPFWEKHREVIRQMFAPVTEALVADALIGSRHAVLDIATGPGEPALSVAAVVGTEGKVVGIDPVRRWRRRPAGRRTVLGLRMHNSTLPPQTNYRFGDSFDAVVSRFG